MKRAIPEAVASAPPTGIGAIRHWTLHAGRQFLPGAFRRVAVPDVIFRKPRALARRLLTNPSAHRAIGRAAKEPSLPLPSALPTADLPPDAPAARPARLHGGAAFAKLLAAHAPPATPAAQPPPAAAEPVQAGPRSTPPKAVPAARLAQTAAQTAARTAAAPAPRARPGSDAVGAAVSAAVVPESGKPSVAAMLLPTCPAPPAAGDGGHAPGVDAPAGKAPRPDHPASAPLGTAGSVAQQPPAIADQTAELAGIAGGQSRTDAPAGPPLALSDRAPAGAATVSAHAVGRGEATPIRLAARLGAAPPAGDASALAAATAPGRDVPAPDAIAPGPPAPAPAHLPALAEAPSVPSAAVIPDGAAPALPGPQLAQAITLLHLRPDGGSQLTVRLDPAELGQVQVSITRSPSGAASVSVAVERPETLRALQSDVTHLHLALDRAGVPEQRSLLLHVSAPQEAAGPAPQNTGGGSQQNSHEGSRQQAREPSSSSPPAPSHAAASPRAPATRISHAASRQGVDVVA